MSSGLQGDVGPGPRNNVVWVPSLAAAIVGDIAFGQVHLSLRATDAQSRTAWRQTLRLIQERHPRIVVAGHKHHPDLPDTPDVLAFNEAYLAEFEAALAASRSAAELVAAMKRKFPEAGLDRDPERYRRAILSELDGAAMEETLTSLDQSGPASPLAPG